MVNTSMIIPGEVGSKFLFSKVDKEIRVLGIIRGYVEEVFVREVHIDG
jgi:hypothetical protein